MKHISILNLKLEIYLHCHRRCNLEIRSNPCVCGYRLNTFNIDAVKIREYLRSREGNKIRERKGSTYKTRNFTE